MRADISIDDSRWFTDKIYYSVVSHRGSPVIVTRSLPEKGRYKVVKCSDRREYTVSRNRLDLTPVPLGNIQTPQGVVRAVRVPSRTWKIGLSANNLQSVMAFDDLIFSEGFLDCYHNRYPSFEECLITENETAFSREWSVKNVNEDYLLLRYRGKDVGYVIKKAPRLVKEFLFLKESLEECL